jgi:hypothetical protein
MMNRAMPLVLIGIGVAGLLAAYILITGFDAPAAVESGIQSVRELVTSPPPATEDDAEEADEADADTTPEPAAPRPAAPPEPEVVPPVEPPAEPLPAPVDVVPEPVAPAPPASAPSGRAPLNRASHFLPGNQAMWTDVGVAVTTPIALRAGGVVSATGAEAGPAGTATPASSAAGTANELVLPSAPYLSLIGRICSDDVCSPPFLVGSGTTLCPSDLPMTGRLQLLTNNYVRVNGRQTMSPYSAATGGYALYTEPAPRSACDADEAARPMRQDTAALAAGEVLSKPEFTLSSGLTFWKPFFLPMGGPFVIRASGRIESTSGRPATTPDGVTIPDDRRWWTTDEETGTTGREARLYLESVPYQALIGRVCGAGGCGEPFVVGRERVICPAAPYNDRVELWINRVIAAPGMLDNQTPLTFEMFDLQTQRGGYRFDVAPAPAGVCGG